MYLEKDDDVLCTHSARKGRGERAWPRRDCGTHILYGTSATAIARDHRPATLCVRPALAVLCVPVGGLSPAYRRWYGTFDPMQMIPAQHTILPHAASSVRAHHDVSPAPNRPDQTDQTDWYSLQAPKPPPLPPPLGQPLGCPLEIRPCPTAIRCAVARLRLPGRAAGEPS